MRSVGSNTEQTEEERERADTSPEPAAPVGGLALELLVHGVGGTTPREMLNDPRTERVSGDGTAAVHRRAADVDAEERPEEYTDRPIPEAYCWSNLTSGNSARALWLVLLPFMVVNLAHWTRPAAAGRATLVRLHGVLVRLVALSLTVLLVAAACQVALDLMAWQCAGTPRCSAGRDWLSFLAAGPEDPGGWWSQPGRRLALAAAVPAALTVLLWWLSHRTWSAYEAQPPWREPDARGTAPHGRKSVAEGSRERVDGTGGHATSDTPALCLRGFWYGRRHVARLRAAHTAAGFLTVAGALVAATTRFDGSPGDGGVLGTLGWVLGGLVVAGAVAVVCVVCGRGRKEHEPDEASDSTVVRLLPGAAAAVLVLAVVHAAWSRPGWVSDGKLPGDATFGVLALLQGVLIAMLAILGLLLHHTRRVPRTALTGLAPAAVAMLGCGLGGVLSGGVTQWAADWLGDSIAGPPTVLTWQAAAIPVLLGALLALLCVAALRLRRRADRLAEEVHHDYPEAVRDASRSRRIGGAIARAGLTDATPLLVGFVASITPLLGAAAVAGSWLTGTVPGAATNRAPDVLDGFADTVQALGSYLIGLAFLIFLAWGRRAYRDPSARRTIGILWDVGTFWPRAAHPFAPPCYAERAVPDLVWRMATWPQLAPGRRIVISGHSQGSVLAAAAVWQLDPITRRHVALLTYGSPLERLYGRWFPAYFGPSPLGSLHRDIDCWRNLWRLTDPIGGPIRLPGAADKPEVDRGPLHDPLAYGRTPSQPLPAPILGHSDYQADPVFDQERDGLLARLRGSGLPAQSSSDVPLPTGQRGAGRSSA